MRLPALHGTHGQSPDSTALLGAQILARGLLSLPGQCGGRRPLTGRCECPAALQGHRRACWELSTTLMEQSSREAGIPACCQVPQQESTRHPSLSSVLEARSPGTPLGLPRLPGQPCDGCLRGPQQLPTGGHHACRPHAATCRECVSLYWAVCVHLLRVVCPSTVCCVSMAFCGVTRCPVGPRQLLYNR